MRRALSLLAGTKKTSNAQRRTSNIELIGLSFSSAVRRCTLPCVTLMNILRLLFDPRGLISRAPFAFTTLVLAAVKIAGDFALARLVFSHNWGVREYLFPHLALLFDFSPGVWRFDAVLLLWAAPFVWMGLCLLVKRLRSARAPVSLVVLFFVPIAKFFLFAVLCVLPERKANDAEVETPLPMRRWAPES